ncbi:MAG: CidA/LrgA family protein [Alphaproteobacteria bacterium]|nr:CidA/LrgA family protein [Alphaproteobacteria bacterium]MBU0798950.1 CidA/LrgA family protein [Alphaproteobacteria bacterium]MBU0887704.1 CidA/LrgA family protein [Alphaproteobacteria bacterium]MBU1812657.1 CidA/LrgA family protein [Alphaproteobacteria bacterium]
MLNALTILLVFQLTGEVIARASGLPLPGPVIGMALLFAALLIRGGLPDSLRSTAGGLLKHLSLLFVPAGVGVVLHLQLIADQWQAISAALLVSTIVTIAVSALMMIGLDRLTGRKPAAGEPKP